MASLSRRALLAAGAAILPFAPTAVLAQQGTMRRTLDPTLAMRLLIDGRKQKTICDLALDRIRSEPVGRFAQEEIREHLRVQDQLRQLGYEYRVATDDPRTVGSDNPGFAGRPVFVPGQGTIPAAVTEVLLIDHEIGEQRIATLRSELGQLRGLDFERRFIESQLDAHYHLYNANVTFRRHASPELAQILAESRGIIERHLQTCKQLRMQMG